MAGGQRDPEWERQWRELMTSGQSVCEFVGSTG